MTRQMKFSLGFGLIAAVLALYMVIFWPHDRQVKNLGVFLFKLVPFFFAALSVALIDQAWIARFRLALPLLFLVFLIFFCIFVPEIFFYIDVRQKVYYLFLMMIPYIILGLCLAFRLGGAGTGSTLRLAFSLLFLMLSGIEDLAYILISLLSDPHFTSIPEVWSWASHMQVRLGHFPTKYEAFGFIALHIGLAFFIAYYPFKMLARLKKYFGVP